MNRAIRIPAAAIMLCIGMLFLASAPGIQAADTDRSIRLAHTNWSSSVASANLAKAVFEEKLGIKCELVSMDVDKMWAAVAEGKADATLSAWLPETHANYYERFSDRVVNLGPNLEGTKIGLVVPNVTAGRLTAGTGIRNKPYIDIDSIPELKAHADKFNHRIIGIEPEAGIMRKTREAMEVYGLADFRLVESSEISMVAELSNAIRHQNWIVVTGWLPHWIFSRWNLKFLDDPEGIYDESGHISTIVRKGLQADMPRVYQVLDNFFWEPGDVGQLMMWIQEDKGRFPYEKALRWIQTHPDRVDKWLP
ncbi:MAG: glycine betaine ABC transporter substrate-binding protein [Desulfosalsimonas sp.]